MECGCYKLRTRCFEQKGRMQDEGGRWLENVSDTRKGVFGPASCFLHTQKYTSDPRDGIVLKICCLLDCSEAVDGKLHCFRRTTHSRSGDIQVGMGMSYSITRSGNLHSNAPKSAPIFPPALASHCFSSTQFTPLRGVWCTQCSTVYTTTLHC